VWFAANKLSVNLTKTECMLIGSIQRLTNIKNPDIKMGCQQIKRGDEHVASIDNDNVFISALHYMKNIKIK
jgi:hypothetical protein